MKSRNNSSVILAVIAICLITIAVLTVNKSAEVEELEVVQGAFLPYLQGNADKVESFAIRKDGAQVKVVLEDGNWVIPDLFGYQVESNKVRNLIKSAENYVILEKKTNNSAHYETLGVEDISEDQESKATRFTLMDKSGTNVYADYIKGVENRSSQSENNNTFYARLANDSQVYLVKADFDSPMNFHEILSKKAYHIESDRIFKARFTHPGQKTFEASRPDSSGDFKIANNTKELKDPVLASHISTLLEGAFIIGNAMPADYKEFDPKETSVAEFETFDGLLVKVESIYLAKQYWVKISASTQSEDEVIKEEADKINALASPWVYRVIDKTGELLRTKLSDIVKETEAK